MSCKWCKSNLSDAQVYDYLRGRTKGTACSRKCSAMLSHYGDISKSPKYIKKSGKIRKLYTGACRVCKNRFESTVKNQQICSAKCSGVLSSKRMTENNPMSNPVTREKVSKTLKSMGHKPSVQGGNGRGLTVWQDCLFTELYCVHDSFEAEYVVTTSEFPVEFKTPNHYKIDIASKELMIAIEVDGTSHNSIKVKECDLRKNKWLSLAGWKVLRLSNSEIEKGLDNCVQMVMSMT